MEAEGSETHQQGVRCSIWNNEYLTPFSLLPCIRDAGTLCNAMRLTSKLGLAALVAVAAGAILAPGLRAQSKAPTTKAPAKTATKPKSGTTTKSTTSKPAAKKKTTTKRRSTRARRQTVPTNDRIREIQAELVRRGHLKGEPNGKWDTNSIAAMKDFQTANGLRATGKFDAASLQKLGLGSETAGMAAPRPLASAGETGSRQR